MPKRAEKEPSITENEESFSGAKLKFVSPDQLLFDAENPRFGGQLIGKDQGEIYQALLGPPYYATELVDSFVQNGFIPYEPLVVRQHNDKFIVVEGNRRLAAIREIRTNPSNYPNKASDLALIPVLTFPEDTSVTSSDIRIYLGIRHLLGFREWPPLSKAEFLDREIKREGGLNQIIKEIRITKQQIRRFLVPYRLLKSANAKIPSGEDFWVLGEALNRAGVKKFVQLDVDPDSLEILSFNRANFRLLLDDLYGPRDTSNKRDTGARKIFDTRSLSLYSKVLSSDKAAKVLHGGRTLSEAAIYVDTRDESLKRLSKLVREMDLLLKKLSAGKRDAAMQEMQQGFRDFESSVRAFLKKNA